MRTIARTGTTLIALGAATLLLGACGGDDPEISAAAVEDAVSAAADGDAAAGTVEEGAEPGDADACALYAADGEAFVDAYDYYGSGASDDPSELLAAAETLAADVDGLSTDEVSSPVLATAEEISASAAAVAPALEAGEGVEEIDATISGLETLADTCAEIGAI